MKVNLSIPNMGLVWMLSMPLEKSDVTLDFTSTDQVAINPMGIVCDFNYLCFLEKPTPNPSEEGN